MISLPAELRFLFPLVLGIIGAAIFLQSDAAYPAVVLLLVFLGTYAVTRRLPDRGFYLVCSGVLLAAAAGLMNIWVGLFALLMVAGTISTGYGLLENRADLQIFLLFCGISSLITLVIGITNHVLLPLGLFVTCFVAILLVQSVRTYRFRKHYSGGGRES